jgi:hypothetical protein
MEIQDKIVMLYDEGFTSGKIAQKLRIKKARVEEVLGNNAKSSGLGDTISKITAATGIDEVADKVAKAVGADDCGCKARAKTLNELFPYKKMNDLSNEDYAVLEDWFNDSNSTVSPSKQAQFVEVYNRVFNAKRKVSNCSPCVASMLRDLKVVFDAAQNK